MFYLDDKSDGFGKLLLDMIERDPGLLFVIGLAQPTWGIMLLPTRLTTSVRPSN